MFYNSEAKSVDIVNISDPSNPLLSLHDILLWAVNSVAVHDTIVAAAIENTNKQMQALWFL